MEIAKIENGSITASGFCGDLFPQISFPNNVPSDAWLVENGCKTISRTKTHDPATHKLVDVQPYLEGDVVYAVAVEPQTQEELQETETSKATQIRSQRGFLLAASVDRMNPLRWEAMTDADKQAWRDYRQALLDVPAQQGFPWNVTWPVKP